MVNSTSTLSILPSEAVYILAWIEFLVVLTTMLFLVMFITDIFRGHFHDIIVKSILGAVNNVSDSMVIYVMGAMQAARFKNQLLPVWAIVLVGFRHSMDFISGHGVPDYQGKRFFEVIIVFKYLGLAFLNRTRVSELAYPLWSLWGLQIVRTLYRFGTRALAFSSAWYGKSSELVSEHMRIDEHRANFIPEECNPETMKGYKYLVYGETRRHIRLQKPRYVLQIDMNPKGRAQAQRQEMIKARNKARGEDKASRGRDRAAHTSGQVENVTEPMNPQGRQPAEREIIVESVSPQTGHPAERGTSTRDPTEREKKYTIGSASPKFPCDQNGSTNTDLESLITLDKIWRCNGALLSSTQGDKFKDLSLAFSLSRLLRSRLEDVKQHKESIPITKKLVVFRIIKEHDPERAFGIMELEMAFINDYFNTRFPMIFWGGLSSLCFSVTLSVATLVVICWLSADISRLYHSHKDEVTHTVHGIHVDRAITWFFMLLMMFKEFWEMVSYLLSDWTRLLLACSYVQKVCRCMRNGLMEKFISSFLTSKIAHHRWHGVIDQHAFLQSYDDSPSVWNLVHTISTGAIRKKEEGTKLEENVKIPESVKHAILKTLRSLDLTHDHLLNVVPTLVAEPRERYRWACSELPTSSHIILVWHIATSLCEIKFASDRGINLSSPGFPLSAMLYLTSFCRHCCCPPQPYLVNENILNGDLKTGYTVANSLSRYCAYLLVAKPDLLPDSFLVPKIVFEDTIKDARRILKGCDSLEKKYKRLMDEASQDIRNSDYNKNVVQKGAKLAKELIDYESEKSCWEILAGVWVDLLVHIAPSWNAEAHKKCLESGGELITHIWTLLWHCGIEKSKLWPVEDVPETQNRNIEINNVQLVKPVWQDAGAWERENKQQMPATTTLDGGHRPLKPGLTNRQGNVVRKMQNLGNTCYLNAALQSLLALDELRVRMLEQDPPPGGSLHLELKKLFMDTSGANYEEGTLVLENLFKLMCSRHEEINQGNMADSNHALHLLLNDLINEEPEGRDFPSTVESLFNGQVVKSVSSKQCGHNSVTTEALVLSLAIPSKKPVSIKECLDLYTTGEVDDWECKDCTATAANASSSQTDTTVDKGQIGQLNSETHQKEQFSCSAEKKTSTPNQDKGKLPFLDGIARRRDQHHNKLEENKIRRVATIKYCINKAPPVLTVQLKRFKFLHDDESGKLEEHVNFQGTLDITEYMDTRYVDNDKYIYCLVAVIVHEGRKLDEGHFFAYVRASRTGGQKRESSDTHSWFLANDEKVEEVSFENVLECEAYILFYERARQ
uniref:USP domain-containing protein n=1 Tax=Leersia perrieri TaxID=77586 RepID=A0A0D9XU91_9ORYZ